MMNRDTSSTTDYLTDISVFYIIKLKVLLTLLVICKVNFEVSAVYRQFVEISNRTCGRVRIVISTESEAFRLIVISEDWFKIAKRTDRLQCSLKLVLL